jgi:hypothetical protein
MLEIKYSNSKNKEWKELSCTHTIGVRTIVDILLWYNYTCASSMKKMMFNYRSSEFFLFARKIKTIYRLII